MLDIVLHKDVNGHVIADPLSSYAISDEPNIAQANSDPLYYGFLAADGAWFILKRSVISGTDRYAAGRDNYQANYAAKESLAYDYLSEIF